MIEKSVSGARRIAGYVLAGGASSRFGRDKALVELGGVPMLLRIIRLLDAGTQPVTVVAPPERYAALQVNSIPDRWPGAGPLGGITTALQHSAEFFPGCAWNLILGCDLPFLTREWLADLAIHATGSRAQAVLPRSANGFEPLCACYRTDAGAALVRALEAGVRKITTALEPLAIEVLDEKHWKRFDSAGRLFRNMNSAAEYEEIRAEWEAKGK